MASVSSARSSFPSFASSSSSLVLRQVSRQSLFSRVKMDLLKDVTALSFFPHGVSAQLMLSHKQCNWIVTHAVAETLTEEPSKGVEEGALTTEALKLKLESDLLKKKAKRAELRRRRLVRKRHLRKKGRWPPSKMAKLKNV